MDAQPATRTTYEVEPTLLSLVYELLDAHQEALARYAAGTGETS